MTNLSDQIPPPVRREPAQTFVASSKIRAVVRAEIKRFADGTLAEAMGKAISQIVGERCAALEAEIVGLRTAASEFRYRGTWVEGESYKCGNFVSLPGRRSGIWHANTATQARPGSDKSWSLAVKSGRDGRDGKAAGSADR